MSTDKKQWVGVAVDRGDRLRGRLRQAPKVVEVCAWAIRHRKGRPRGSRDKAQGLKENRLREIILAEAYRPIKVNDGKKRITVPMAEAIVRSLAVNAARGHLRSQQAFAKMLTESEKVLRLEKKQLLETALSYKLNARG